MLEVEDKVLLENDLKDCIMDIYSKKNKDELCKYFLLKGYNNVETKYLIYAYFMPYERILTDIINCENIDSMDFIYNMVNKYGYKENIILTRISDVLKINTYNVQLKRQF